MGSEVMKIPTIDFRKLELKLQGSEEWISVRDQVFKALEEYGCFEALLDGVSKDSLYEKLKQVFKLPLETKFDVAPQASTGYAWNPMMPLYERLVLYDVLTPSVIESFSKILWPDGEPEFCDLALSYAKRLSELDEMIRKMVFEKLGVQKHWDDHTKSIGHGLGFFKYRVPKPEETRFGLPPHTDKKISTILSQHKVNGVLQVMKNNGQWFDVEYSSPDSFIFIVNDCFTALTNGRLHSPTHRVIMGNEERYTMGFSTVPKYGYIIKVLEELVDEDHPLLYKPFDGAKYLDYCLTGGADASLESFCGI